MLGHYFFFVFSVTHSVFCLCVGSVDDEDDAGDDDVGTSKLSVEYLELPSHPEEEHRNHDSDADDSGRDVAVDGSYSDDPFK